jgi:hypothetical protein
VRQGGSLNAQPVARASPVLAIEAVRANPRTQLNCQRSAEIALAAQTGLWAQNPAILLAAEQPYCPPKVAIIVTSTIAARTATDTHVVFATLFMTSP